MTAEEAALAERAWCMRVHERRRYVDIALELGWEDTPTRPLGQVAMDWVQRFDAEIEAGLRERPAEPKRRRRLAG